MKRRNFLSTCATFFATGLTWKAAGKPTSYKSTSKTLRADDQYIVVNNWYLKKEDLKNS